MSPSTVVPSRGVRLNRWLKRHQGQVVGAWMLALLFAVGTIGVYLAGEDDRFRQIITAEQQRQAQEGLKRTQALCRDFKDRAEVEVLPDTTDLGRVLVRTAAANYSLLGCERLRGPLAPGKPDPEAYRPSPPAGSPSPRR